MRHFYRILSVILICCIIAFNSCKVDAHASLANAGSDFLSGAAITYADAVGLFTVTSGVTAAALKSAFTTEVLTGYASSIGTTVTSLATDVAAGTAIAATEIVFTAAAAAILAQITYYAVDSIVGLDVPEQDVTVSSSTTYVGWSLSHLDASMQLIGTGSIMYYDTATSTWHYPDPIVIDDTLNLTFGPWYPNSPFYEYVVREGTTIKQPYDYAFGWHNGSSSPPTPTLAHPYIIADVAGNGLYYPYYYNGSAYQRSSFSGSAQLADLYTYIRSVYSRWYSGSVAPTISNSTVSMRQASDFAPVVPDSGDLVLSVPSGSDLAFDPSAPADDAFDPYLDTLSAPISSPDRIALDVSEALDDPWAQAPTVDDAYADGTPSDDYPTDDPIGTGLFPGDIFAGIWHYVLEVLAYGAEGLDLIKAFWVSLPYAAKLPLYATITITFVFGVLSRLLM